MGKSVSIRFQFDARKFVNAVAFLAERIRDLDKLKTAKLLYFADKYHVVRYGRPILGDRYHSLDYGPVPSMALDIMNETIHDPSTLVKKRPYRDLFQRYIAIDRNHCYPRFKMKRSPNLEVFSESEREALDHTVAKYGAKSGGELIQLTHREAAWKETAGPGEMDYRLFFKDCREASPEALKLLEDDQVARDLLEAINSR